MLTHDVRWLGHTYGEFFKIDGLKIKDDTECKSSDEEGIHVEMRETPDEEPAPKTKGSPQVVNHDKE